jgi:hypothetical protein
MFAKCSNPQCRAPFDYREGQLIRLCNSPLADPSPADQNHVEHFWLRGSCSRLYVSEYRLGEGMKIKLRVREPQADVALSFVTAG